MTLSPTQSDSLRTAAAALLTSAPNDVLLPVLRLLLEPWQDQRRQALPMPAQRPSPPPPQAPKSKTPKSKPTDGEWDERRREIRAAMLERGVSYNGLAGQFGVAVATLRHALGRREPPTRAMRERLETWLESEPAPAVAAEPPFRANGAGRLHGAGDGTEQATAAG